jgi:Fe-S cluster assembly protein SufD
MEQAFDLKDHLIKLYHKNIETLSHHDNPEMKEVREKGMAQFIAQGFPNHGLEQWKNTDLRTAIDQQYDIALEPQPYNPVESYFTCKVHNFDTYMFTLLNGWYVHKNAPLTTFPDGTIVGSLATARELFPEIVNAHLAKYSHDETNPMTALNTAFMQDGFFVYVPENVHLTKPMQVVSLVNTDQNLLIQSRNLIITERNSSLKLVHCDDSIKFGKTFINTVTEIVVGENSAVEYYKLENKDDRSALINNVYVQQATQSCFTSNTITFNAGVSRNNTIVKLDGEYCESDIMGLYLVDGNQKVDNYVMVHHLKPNGRSNQLFKGIIDDEAKGSFNGHVIVHRDAQKTQAFQSNKNIALTDTAVVNTKPFLEIYADDVKCSHGATVGQLDPEALFYLRSRGICERNARMLLLYAFAMDVVNHVKIDALKDQIDNMVSKRLSGELTICDQCVLHCSDETHLDFEIDLSKI